MKTYLVTGAAGFIAARVCHLLVEAGNRVIGVDNLNPYYDVRLKDNRLNGLLNASGTLQSKSPLHSAYSTAKETIGAGGQFIFSDLDIEDEEGLERIFKSYRFDAVFNLAARAGVRYSLVNPKIYMTSNAIGTLNILECMRRHGIKKFILSSTSSLYAGSPMPFEESQPVNTPLSPYAASKKAAEAIAYAYHKQFQIDVSILRYFTVYGPAGRPDMAPFRFIQWIKTRKPIIVYGDGEQTRDFTYVDDIARGTILAEKKVGYEIINLGGGNKPITLNQMIAILEERIGEKAIIDRRDTQPTDMHDTAANVEKARQYLDWEPQTPPEIGFQKTAKWHQHNQSWLADIDLGV